jgi:hypothetical protein
MSELDWTNIAASSIATPAAGVTAGFTDTADKRTKTKDDTGAVNILVNDGLQDRNILDNGSLMIRQRVATASTAITGISTTTRGGVVADRWSVTTSVATNLNWAQIDSIGSPESGLLARYYGSIIASTAGKKVMLSQFLVASQMAHLRGKIVRFSLKHNQKVGSGQTYKLGIIQLQTAGTVDAPPAFLSGAWSTSTGVDPAWNTNTLQITPETVPTAENGTVTGNYINVTSVAGTWTRSSGCFTIPSNCKGLYVVFFSDATGGTTDNISIAELQLTQGYEIVDFVQCPDEEELNRCQTFYCKTFAATTVPAQNIGISKGEAFGIAGIAGATALAGIIWWRFPMRMWKTPTTITLYNPAAANALMRMTARAADMGATASVTHLDSSVVVTATGVAATAVGDQIGIHITADAEVVV